MVQQQEAKGNIKTEEKSNIKTEDNSFYDASSYNRFINTNNQLITSWVGIGTESMKIFNEYTLRLTKFNMSVMSASWIPFLYSAKPENKEKA